MRVSKAHIENGMIVEDQIKEIKQSSLTSDCWGIQFWGLSQCKECEFKDTNECGGGETLKRMRDAERKNLG